ncbi:MAG TPA: nuclear transport factor 2 family protein, partial [Chthoniobacterales bacterium]|nr:nuclear transport factor 2 family protein [Chthoniobacterales bacterium]
MITSLVGLIAAVLAAGALPDPAVVAEAEKRFAAAGWERGIRSSFLEFLADDSVVFDPGPKNGKAVYKDHPAQGPALHWEPVFAAISRSGDLGVTTGPWHIKKSKTDEKPVAYGEFSSIWKKQPDQSWKVAVDLGIAHGEPTGSKPPLQLCPPSSNSPNDPIAEPEGRFGQALRLGDADKAFTEFADEDIRLLRDGSLPLVGKAAATLALSAGKGTVTRNRIGGGASEAGD